MYLIEVKKLTVHELNIQVGENNLNEDILKYMNHEILLGKISFY